MIPARNAFPLWNEPTRAQNIKTLSRDASPSYDDSAVVSSRRAENGLCRRSSVPGRLCRYLKSYLRLQNERRPKSAQRAAAQKKTLTLRKHSGKQLFAMRSKIAPQLVLIALLLLSPPLAEAGLFKKIGNAFK